MSISGYSCIWSCSRLAAALNFAELLGKALQRAEVEMLVRETAARRAGRVRAGSAQTPSRRAAAPRRCHAPSPRAPRRSVQWSASQPPRSSQRQFAISVRRHRIAVLAKGGMAAAVAHDLAGLLALDIAVDAGHPRVDLVHQQPLARRHDVVGPARRPRRRWPRSGSGRGRARSGSGRSPNRRCIRRRAENCRARHAGPSPSACWGSPRPGRRDRSAARPATCPSAARPSTPRMSMRSKLPVIASNPVA